MTCILPNANENCCLVVVIAIRKYGTLCRTLVERSIHYAMYYIENRGLMRRCLGLPPILSASLPTGQSHCCTLHSRMSDIQRKGNMAGTRSLTHARKLIRSAKLAKWCTMDAVTTNVWLHRPNSGANNGKLEKEREKCLKPSHGRIFHGIIYSWQNTRPISKSIDFLVASLSWKSHNNLLLRSQFIDKTQAYIPQTHCESSVSLMLNWGYAAYFILIFSSLCCCCWYFCLLHASPVYTFIHTAVYTFIHTAAK